MATQFKHFVLIIIAATDRVRGLAATQQLPNAVLQDAVDTFAGGLSPTGALPASHYWAAGAFRDAAFTKLQQLQAGFPGSFIGEFDPDADSGFPDRKLVELGLQRIAGAS